MLNKQQNKAVMSTANRIVAVAGPGAGKTHTLVSRIVHLLESGVKPADIVVITFTNAAAEELKKRIYTDDGLGEGTNDAWQPFQHIGTLHAYMLKLLRSDGAAIGLPEQLAVIDEETADDILDEVCHEQNYKGNSTTLGNELESVPFLELQFGTMTGARLVSSDYHRRLIENGLLDYNAILCYGLHVLHTRNQSKAPPLAEHLLVDEFQDSGEMDAKIYAAFPAKNKFFVGDPDQSIYAFRMGSPKHMLNLAKIAKTIILDVNYRSDARICEAANNLIGHNSGRVEKSIVPNSTEFGQISDFSSPTEAEENTKVLWEIGCEINGLGGYDRVAVLFRANWQVNAMADYLRSRGIPVKERQRSDKPMDWRRVRQMVAFLANPENDILAFDVLKWLKGLEYATVMKRKAAGDLTTINQACKLVTAAGSVEAVPNVLGRSGISPESIVLVEAVLPGCADIGELSLRLSDSQWDAQEQGQGVTVSTIHGAKGREWDTVILPGWNQELFPGKRTGEDLEELRRLAFVAVTRARHQVVILWAKERRLYSMGNPVATTPSRFIAEMGL